MLKRVTLEKYGISNIEKPRLKLGVLLAGVELGLVRVSMTEERSQRPLGNDLPNVLQVQDVIHKNITFACMALHGQRTKV